MTILKPKGVDRPAQTLNETTGCQEAIEQTKATIVEPHDHVLELFYIVEKPVQSNCMFGTKILLCVCK